MRAVLYVHGYGGGADEARAYEDVFGCPVTGVGYTDFRPWAARETVRRGYRALAARFDGVGLLAVSIGAYFSMLALSDLPVERAFFISPLVDPEGLILRWMAAQGVTEAALREKGSIPNRCGEPFSWEYLSYVRAHPLRWRAPTEILCADRDGMMPPETMRAFAGAHGAGLTVIDAEHYIRPERVVPFLREKLKTGGRADV